MRGKGIARGIAAVLVVAAAAVAYAETHEPEPKVEPAAQHAHAVQHAHAAHASAELAGAHGAHVSTEVREPGAAAPEMTVYLTPTCGCCGAGVDHVKEHGFTVNLVYQDDLSDVRRQHGVPPELTSCHMGVVDGFAVEGHVPADVVHRLLRERPSVLGIAVPGMPAGSPGMELPNGRVDRYGVYTFDSNGPGQLYELRP
jgi:hypothetical protein